MDQTSSERELYDWLHFVGRSSDEGRHWAEEYRQIQSMEELRDRSLLLLRRRRFEEGYELLAQLGEGLRSAEGAERSIRSVLERWYYGVLGYYFYCVEEFDQAERAMVQAHDAVAAAIGERRFLLPLANHCHEFRLHRARIARNRCRWVEMRSHVEEVRGMIQGRLPFCVLHDGTEVRLPALRTFYTSIPSFTEAEWVSVSHLLDDTALLRDFGQFVHGMYRVPGFVIPYP